MTFNFVPLHVHSHYSLLDGLIKIDDLVSKTKEYGFSSVALTDHGVMYGAIEFYQKALKAGIKPIIGCEVYIAPRTMEDKQPKIDNHPHHLVLLAKGEIGYKNLVKLVTEAHLKGFYYKPRIDKDLLKKYSEGLVALTACLHGEIPKLITNGKYNQAKEACQFYIDTFGKNNFFLEMQYHPELPDQKKTNEGLKKLSKEMNLNLVVTNDTHYLNKDDREAHEVLLSVQTGKDIDDKDRLSMANVDLSFLTSEEMQKNFPDTPEAITNTLKIAEMCKLEFTLGKPILPKFDLPGGNSPMNYLKDLAEQGFTKRYNQNDKIAFDRLNYELSVIEKTGFADYFLIVQDFINWAKAQGIIVGPGRGSAAGSIISYCLNITTIEPIKYGLLFERFLNPERISMPDIDVDFADDRRDEVISYVREKYGEDHVAQIITFGTMAARGSIRDTARALAISYSDGDRLAKLIPMGLTINQALSDVKELRHIYESEQNMKRLIDMAKKLEGVARHASTHACGVVISREPLTQYLPLQQATKGENAIITQYSMWDVDAIGLLKIDFLGLSNLTIMKNTLRIIKKTKNQEIDINKVPLDNKKTFELLTRGETTGVFQLESDGMKRYIKELKPNTFEDIMLMVSLYRPGPIQLIPSFINRKHGKEKVTYLHPLLKNSLKETYGIPVYQEQVMQASRDLAGFTGGQADTLRKAIGKKIAKLMAEVKIKFIKGCKEFNSIDEATANKIWKLFEDFAAYGFNKSHACCYAYIAYQTAYLKANYPVEFMAALLTSDFQNLDRISIEIAECERMNVKVLSPTVNRSFVEFGVDKETGQILFGLSAIKNVGLGIAQSIVEERKKNGKYESLEDFLSRLGPDIINKKVVESLAKAGAMDEFAERNQILAGVETILKFSSGIAKEKASHQSSLFTETTSKQNTVAKLNLPQIEPAPKKQYLAWEKELLGIYISEHPLSEHLELIKGKTRDIASLTEKETGKTVLLAGIITEVKKIITKSQEPMLFVRIEDTSAGTEVIVFPKILKNNFLIWHTDNIVVIKGKINNKDGIVKVIAEEVREITQQTNFDDLIVTDQNTLINDSNLDTKKNSAKGKIIKEFSSIPDNINSLILTIDKSVSKIILSRIKQIIKERPGETAIIIKVPSDGGWKEIKTSQKIKMDRNTLNTLTELISEDKIELV